MRKVLVVCHDAGAANILAALIKKYRNDVRWKALVDGPAKAIFAQEKIKGYLRGEGLKSRDIDHILEKVAPDLVLTGTGWGSTLELEFIARARNRLIKTAAFLDHWGNYRERFGYPGKWKERLPDFVLVGDKWAYQIAIADGFPKKCLKKVENPYFEQIITCFRRTQKTVKESAKTRILLFSAPLFEFALKKYRDPYHWGYTEYSILEDVLSLMCLLQKARPYELKIRMHPAEKIGKYSTLLNGNEYAQIYRFVSLSDPKKSTLIDDCSWADVAIGPGSTALCIASMLGKKVFSYAPAKKRISVMPQKEIKAVNSLQALKKELMGFHKGRAFRREKPLSGPADNRFLKAVEEMVG